MKNKISSQKFDDYNSMTESAKNWDIHCAYRFVSHGYIGVNSVIELPSMQLSYSYREGGFMHSAISPKDSFSIAVVCECKGIATFDSIKLSKGDILFFDDQKAYKFMSKDPIKVVVISIANSKMKHLYAKPHAIIGHYMSDSKDILSDRLRQTLKAFKEGLESLDLQQIEDDIILLLVDLFETQTPKKAKLTKGEESVLEILEQVYGHMDGKICVGSLATQYKLSEHTLQNSFKSLFGFTPKRFLRILKLNHVHHDLKHAIPASNTVSRIAQKWGFSHMGRFSRYYTDLFGENPSVTLRRVENSDSGITDDCALRQEEMN